MVNTPIAHTDATSTIAPLDEVNNNRTGIGAESAEYHRVSSTLSVSFSAVSRPLELSLQSSLQLSLTVLVCYRSRGRI